MIDQLPLPKSWVKSKIVWTSIATFVFASLSLFHILPPFVSGVIDLGTMVLAAATIYFRFTSSGAIK